MLSDDEAIKIAEWLKLKTNQEPYYLFITCLESGARKSEVLGIQWENVDFQNWSIYIPETKMASHVQSLFLVMKNFARGYKRID